MNDNETALMLKIVKQARLPANLIKNRKLHNRYKQIQYSGSSSSADSDAGPAPQGAQGYVTPIG